MDVIDPRLGVIDLGIGAINLRRENGLLVVKDLSVWVIDPRLEVIDLSGGERSQCGCNRPQAGDNRSRYRINKPPWRE